MCLNPIQLKNPVKRISIYGGQQFGLELPCGQCAECKKLMRDAWYFRTYYHCKEIYDKCGYVYFATLTYDPQHLPRISDITDLVDEHSSVDYACFNVQHYRDFFKVLRTWLKRNGYADVKITYFFTTEYGLNPSDGVTFRPHYHVLFFVDNSLSENKLDVYELSEIISHFWKYGKTDAEMYHNSRDYIKKHAFGRIYSRDFIHMRAVCNYVSKYITKDSDFQKVLDERIEKLEERLYGSDRIGYHDRLKIKETIKVVKKSVDQFHRQSQHFGEAYLYYMSMEDLRQVLKTGMQSMADKGLIVKHMPLDMYYKRKLFYVKKKNDAGQEYWTLSEDGKIWKLERLKKTMDMCARKFEDLYKNIYQFMPRDIANDMVSHIDTYMDGRSFKDLSVYTTFYKGKTRYGLASNNIIGFSKLHPAEEDLSIWMRYVIGDVNDLEEGEYIYHYASSSDKKRFCGSRFITEKNLGNKDEGYVGDLGNMYYDYDKYADIHYGYFTDAVKRGHITKKYYGNVETEDEWMRSHCINENTDYRFRDFDKVYNILKQVLRVYNKNTQAKFDKEEQLRKRWSMYRKKLAA